MCRPVRGAELRHYRNHINGLFKSIAAAYAKQVINVDRYICLQVARSNWRLLSDTASFQDAYIISILPAGAAAPGNASSPSKLSRSRNGKTPGACQRWNDERCTMRDCRCRHAYARCGGAHITSLLAPDLLPGPASDRPCRMRGMLWDAEHMPVMLSATRSATLRPLPRPPESELNSARAWQTIHDNPHLFNVVTPIHVDRIVLKLLLWTIRTAPW